MRCHWELESEPKQHGSYSSTELMLATSWHPAHCPNYDAGLWHSRQCTLYEVREHTLGTGIIQKPPRT